MKFSTSIMALAVGAQATLVTRQLATVQKVLTDISSLTGDLDTAIKAYSGDIGSLSAASDKLISTIKSGVTTVTGSSSLSLTDATGIAQYVQGLSDKVSTTVDDLISKKSDFVKNGQGGTILKSLQDQSAASKDLSTAITNKTPTDLQTIAKTLSGQIDASLAKGVAAFQGTGSTSSSASSAAPSSSAASASSHGHSASSSTAAPSSSASSPASSSAAPSKTGTASSSASSKPAVSTGGAVTNGVSGALAALAVILAF